MLFPVPVPVGVGVNNALVANGAMISPPNPALSLSSTIVCESNINSPAVFSDMSVPFSVIPAPGVNAVPAISTAVGAAVRAWLARVVINWPVIVVIGAAEGRGIVADPMMRAEEPREIGMLEIVRAGAPGVRVVPAISTALGRMVMAWLARVVIICEGNAFVRGIGVPVPITRPDEPMDIGVPEMVMAGAPGVRVEPAIETPLGRSCAFWPFIVVG